MISCQELTYSDWREAEILFGVTNFGYVGNLADEIFFTVTW